MKNFQSRWRQCARAKPIVLGNNMFCRELLCFSEVNGLTPKNQDGPGAYFLASNSTSANDEISYFARLGIQITNYSKNKVIIRFQRNNEYKISDHHLDINETFVFAPFETSYLKTDQLAIWAACVDTPNDFIFVGMLPEGLLSYRDIGVSVSCAKPEPPQPEPPQPEPPKPEPQLPDCNQFINHNCESSGSKLFCVYPDNPNIIITMKCSQDASPVWFPESKNFLTTLKEKLLCMKK